MPLDEDAISNLSSSDVTDLQTGNYNIPSVIPDVSPSVKNNAVNQNQTQTAQNTGSGINPNTPTPTNTGTTGDGSGAVPAAASESTGFVAIYHPSRAQVVSFSQWLWSVGFDLDTFKKLFQDPMSAIISLHMLFTTPTDAGTTNIVVGFLDSHVASPYVDDTIITLECGHVHVDEYYHNALDYDPYTEFDIYLPFIGFRRLSANDVVGSDVYVTYNVDVVTGTCVAFIRCVKENMDAILYSYEGNACVQIPLTSANFSSIIASVLSAAISIGATVATGGAAAPLAAVSVANAALGSKVQIERGGNLSGNAGMLAPKKPYLVVRRPISKVAYKYQNLIGYPASTRVLLSSCSGLTRVKAIHLDDIDATDREKRELEAILKSGVVI